MAPHSSTLAWKIPWTEEPGRLQSMGSLRVRHNWVTSLSLFTFMHWGRKWQPTSVFLPGESRDRGAWWAAVYGVAQSRTGLKRLSSSSSDIQLNFCTYTVQIISHINVYLVQFSTQSCPTLCKPMDSSTLGLPVHHQLPEFTQTHVHWVSDATQPSHPLSSPSPPAFNVSQHHGLFKWLSKSYQVAKVLEFQLQHQSFQWTLRTDLL